MDETRDKVATATTETCTIVVFALICRGGVVFRPKMLSETDDFQPYTCAKSVCYDYNKSINFKTVTRLGVSYCFVLLADVYT